MRVYRMEVNTNLFENDILNHHNGFVVEDDEENLYPFDFEIINNETAVIHGENFKYVKEAIEEFRFYAYFITKFLDVKQNVVAEFNPVPLFKTPLDSIQPSQFYVSEEKINRLKTWIKSEYDIVVPVYEKDGALISLDGHSRMMVGLLKGYQYIYTYFDGERGDYIDYFVEEAKKRGITSVNDMKILSVEEYEKKWHSYCDEYFKNK